MRDPTDACKLLRIMIKISKKYYVHFLALSIICFQNSFALCDTLKITNDDIPQIVKSKGLNYLELQNKAKQNQLILDQFILGYKWTSTLDLSREWDNTDTTGNGSNYDSTKDKYSFFLNKKFLTSTTTTFELTQANYKSNAFNTNYAQNYFTLTVDQNLYPFISTPQDQLAYQTLTKDSDRFTLQNELDLNDNIRDAVNLFWKTLAIQKSVQENSDLLKKYEALVKLIQRKRQNSYASAGELEQAFAEYEQRKQNLIDDRNTLENYLVQLKQLLNIKPQDTLELVQVQKTASMPDLYKNDIKQLKRYQIQKLKTASAQDAYEASKLKGLPRFGVYAKFTDQGLDSNSSQSYDEFKNFTKDKYSIGLKLDYTFDDSASEKDREIKSVTNSIEKERLMRSESDLNNQIAVAFNKVENAYTSLKTTDTILKYRSEALKQININYNQGRSDISFLIDALNKKIQAEVAILNAIGNFETAKADYLNLIF